MIFSKETAIIFSTKSLVSFVIILLIASRTSSLQISVDKHSDFESNELVQAQFLSTAEDFTGKYFTTDLINCIKGNISQAEGIYSPSQLANIAAYVAQAMNKRNVVNKYSVYVYDNSTSSAGEFLDQDLGAHLWWIKFGKYQLTYVIDVRSACRNMGVSGAPSPFGQQVTKGDQDFITQVVKNSAVYRGDSVLDAANYIYMKISEKYGRYYKVVVAKPNSNLGFYECRTGEFWAYLKNYTDRQWSYYIVRTEKI